MKAGSLFSGIGGMDLGLERAGWDIRWQVENDKFCNQVLQRHWPEVKRYGDIRTVDAGELEPVDLLCGGFPCQDVSMAGTRKGLAGSESSLFFEAARILEGLKPPYVLIENVPGLLSSNEGKDFQVVLDTLTQIGYAVDVDILDSQEFGVAQRRRRVFLVCVSANHLLKKRTDTSESIGLSLIVQALQCIWDVLLQASYPDSTPLGYEVQSEGNRGSPLRRMQLLSAMLGENPLGNLLKFWDAHLEQSWKEWIAWGLPELEDWRSHILTTKDTEESELKKTGTASGDKNTFMSQSGNSGDPSKRGNLSTTLTWSKQITDLRICLFAEMVLSILKHITPHIRWSETYWNGALLALTMTKELITYAQQASSQFFTEDSMRHNWGDYLYRAFDYQTELERDIRRFCPPEILFEPESLSRDTAPSGKEGTAVAGSLKRRFDSSSSNGSELAYPLRTGRRIADSSGNQGNVVARPIRTREGQRQDETKETYVVNARQDPITRKPMLDTDGHSHAIAVRLAQTSSNGWGITEDGTTHTLDGTGGDAVAQPFSQNRRGELRYTDKIPTLTTGGGKPGEGYPAILAAPLRSEGGSWSSQEWNTTATSTPSDPDRMRAAAGVSKGLDSARYRALGNAVTVPVAEWIGRQLMRHLNA